MNKKAISLFSGAMGLDLGLMQAGIDVQIGQDFDDSCIQTMLANGHILLEIYEIYLLFPFWNKWV